MDFSQKSWMILRGGVAWAFVEAVASIWVVVAVSRNLVQRYENGSTVLVAAENQENIIQLTAWIGFVSALLTGVAAASIFWASKRVRGQALASYEDANGFPFNYAALAEEDFTGRGVLQGLLLGALIVSVLGSLCTVFLVYRFKKDETVEVDYKCASGIGAHLFNLLLELVHARVTFFAGKVSRVVDLAHVPQPVAQAAAGPARQGVMELRAVRQACESDEPAMPSTLRQRNEQRNRDDDQDLEPAQSNL